MEEKKFYVEDVRKLYAAFISLCDYVEENVHCGHCPLWEEMCGNQDQTAVNEFAKALARIRTVAEIKRPTPYYLEDEKG